MKIFKDDETHETQYCENCFKLQKKLETKTAECELLKDEVNELKIRDADSFEQFKNLRMQLQRKIKECYDLKSVMQQFAYDFEDKGENPDLSEMIQIAQQTLERWENDRTNNN